MSVEELSCSVLSMTFFDRLFDAGIVREQGQISKCFDEYIGDFTISDELRKVMFILQKSWLHITLFMPVYSVVMNKPTKL